MKRLLSLIVCCAGGIILANCDLQECVNCDNDKEYDQRCSPGQKITVESDTEDYYITNTILYDGSDEETETQDQYRQCITYDKRGKGLTIQWQWFWPENQDIVAYPGILYGYKPWETAPPQTEFPVAAEHFSARADYSMEIEAEGQYNIAFDIWCGSGDSPSVDTITHEVLVWVHNSMMTPYGVLVGTVTVNGADYDLYFQDDRTDQDGDSGAVWDYFAFVAHEETAAGSLELGPFIDYLVDNAYMKSSTYVDSIEFGNQVISGFGTVDLTSYSITME
ncbi:MAG: GH12 family glycosyl hydrolase domain-containing protein [Spirochaetota bacterium]